MVCPGDLAEQWQDELYRRFHLPFEILTRDKLEAARTGNWFLEKALVVVLLDMLSRNEDLQAKLEGAVLRGNLATCDEAHKLSATFFGGEVNWCFRHQLLLPSPYLVLTKPLRLDIQCQRAASVKIGWKYLDD